MDVEQTLAKLSLDEKIELLSGVDFWHTKAIPRLNIPSLRMSDGPNGVRGSRLFNGVPAACFPCGTALGATWDTDLIRAAGVMMGKEAIAKAASILLGPTINIQRSPLGGRGFESYSEDPVLAGNLAAAMVAGIQSTGVVATPKHFVGNDQEEQRQSSNSVISPRALREVYLLPFQITERDARPMAYMTSYNKVNGIHASENVELLQGILRQEWGFDGLVVSDWFGTYSVAEAINAGLDVEMPGPTRWRAGLAKLSVSSRKIAEPVIDDRVRALLKTIDRVSGLGISIDTPETTVDTPQTAAKLREIAAAGTVLLKNEGGVLPLRKEKTTAVIGPNAAFAAYSGGGSARLRPYYAVTPLEGIQAYVPSTRYALGATNYKKLPMLSALTVAPDGSPGMEMRIYLDPPSQPHRVPVEAFNITDSTCFLNDYKHPAIGTNLFYAEVEGTLVPDADADYLFSLTVNGLARLYVDGEEVVDNETVQRPGESFFGSGSAEEIGRKFLKKDRPAKVLVQFTTAPASKLRRAGATQMGVGGVQIGGCPQTDAATLLSAAVDLAKQVDQVVVCIGLNSEWESEGWDRQTMDLPPGSDALVEAVAAVNANVVVVNQSGTPVTMPWADRVPAIVHAWYGGNETGNAIADVLFGQVNPSGKLSLSWPIRVQDNPAYINTAVDDGDVLYGEGIYVGHRWYEKTEREVLFPFGHGLSYTTFELRDLAVGVDGESKSEVNNTNKTNPALGASKTPKTLTVSGELVNTGDRPGAEVVQVYMSFPTSTVPRPVKELKGFRKIWVGVGKEDGIKRFQIHLDPKYACSYWSETSKAWVLERGTYHVLVGTSSRSSQVRQAGVFEIGQTSRWTGL
ncbi:hypothetical protein A1O3_09114 [Capronia epimyces CBS 606.96]|uniref:beta-glucosidase n=1 Tax=Capronia epimyces CBS 606.96 TaxID=1182542 RepID=W9XKW1_9EURO|nr:uncharacterized protein A1O3_09114 [Capronia epimyces CBS 606.96]EXJ77955.1 hypothetical protein A1O3_09114 [Capronia epimyces CBS 606.96]